MKPEPVAPGCWRIGLFGVNAYLVEGGSGLVLVDTGTGGSAGRLVSAIQGMGRSTFEIGDILLTHQHSDHAGGLGRLADLMNGLMWPFAISSATLALIIGWFRLKDGEPCLLRVLDTVIFLVIIVLYPLAVVDKDSTSFWMQLLYLGALAYVCVLLIAHRASLDRDSARSAGTAPPPNS